MEKVAISSCVVGLRPAVLGSPAGEELQLDWLELAETPWGRQAYVLVGVLPHSGRLRGVFSEGMGFAHLAAALDGLLRRFGGTSRSWRVDRMATFVHPGTDRLRPEAAQLAKHYGVAVAVCPAERPQRKGALEQGQPVRQPGPQGRRSVVRAPRAAPPRLPRLPGQVALGGPCGHPARLAPAQVPLLGALLLEAKSRGA